MINRNNDSINLALLVVLGIVLLISLLLVRPIMNTSLTISNIGLPEDAVNELKKLLGNH